MGQTLKRSGGKAQQFLIAWELHGAFSTSTEAPAKTSDVWTATRGACTRKGAKTAPAFFAATSPKIQASPSMEQGQKPDM